jgi:hypothetical protein
MRRLARERGHLILPAPVHALRTDVKADQEKLDARENDDVAAEITREVLDATHMTYGEVAGQDGS